MNFCERYKIVCYNLFLILQLVNLLCNFYIFGHIVLVDFPNPAIGNSGPGQNFDRALIFLYPCYLSSGAYIFQAAARESRSYGLRHDA